VSEFLAIVGRSRLFVLLCASLQAAILVGATLIFYVDARTIGYFRGGNWQLVIVAVLMYTFLSWVLIGVLGPYSRLGKKVRG
jgi:hypothetical protein